MSHAAPAVALLFDDAELGGQLRDALSEGGARIVHEGGMSTLTRELLAKVGAQVVVVNLDDSADDALDQLYEAIDGDYPRVVFNDAQASRALAGWDRARWARHLAVKVLAMGDIDPPRPEHARSVERVSSEALEAAIARESAKPVVVDILPEQPASAEPAEESVPVSHSPSPWQAGLPDAASHVAPDQDVDDSLLSFAAAGPAANDPAANDDADDFSRAASADSESLAAELEALLASGELSDEEDEAPSGSGLRFSADEELPPLHDGHFGPPTGDSDGDFTDAPKELESTSEKITSPSSVTPPVFQLDHLELAPLSDALLADIPVATMQRAGAESADTRVPDSWALLEDDATVDSTATPDAAEFGIEKVSAADFLAPEADQASPDIDATMSLKLVSMEEAIAPQFFEGINPPDGGGLGQLVLLGATVGALDSVCSFLAALPDTTSLTLVHTQHLAGMPADELAERLSEHASLPVRVATANSQARAGEILVVPSGQQLLLIRDGSIDLMPSGLNASHGPSIDASFGMAANVFGRDALAIVFAGRGDDALAGARAIRDRGGEVWVESSTLGQGADMVSRIVAERLVSFSGTPHQLAARLIEVFP